MRWSVVSVAGAMLVAACATTGEEVGASSAAIVGGAEDDDNDPNTRAVGYLVSGGANFCTASLARVPDAPPELAGRIVLTAAHCLTMIRRGDPAFAAGIKFGFGRQFVADPPYRVVAAMDHPRFSMTSQGEYDSGYDIAVMILDRPVDDRVPLEIDTTSRIGASYTHVGYGLDGKNGNGGTKHRADAEYASENAVIHDVDGTITHTVYTRSPTAALCSGDSGGAMLLRGRAVLAGVHSTAYCEPGTPNASAGVNPLLPWVRQVLSACRDGSRRSFFPQTGIWACGAIADALASDKYGGVPGIGLPISSALYEQNGNGSGQKLFFQWFQRNRVEHVPDSPDPEYRIAFGRLGAETVRREGDARRADAEPGSSCSWIAKADDRGAYVCNAYRNAFNAFGGMRMLGAPITGVGDYRVTVKEGDADVTYAVRAQWFERGRLEEHPSGVLGGLLGCRAASLDRPLAAFQGDGHPRRVTLGCAERLAESFDGQAL